LMRVLAGKPEPVMVTVVSKLAWSGLRVIAGAMGRVVADTAGAAVLAPGAVGVLLVQLARSSAAIINGLDSIQVFIGSPLAREAGLATC
jgi:hypothetical protein